MFIFFFDVDVVCFSVTPISETVCSVYGTALFDHFIAHRVYFVSFFFFPIFKLIYQFLNLFEHERCGSFYFMPQTIKSGQFNSIFTIYFVVVFVVIIIYSQYYRKLIKSINDVGCWI